MEPRASLAAVLRRRRILGADIVRASSHGYARAGALARRAQLREGQSRVRADNLRRRDRHVRGRALWVRISRVCFEHVRVEGHGAARHRRVDAPAGVPRVRRTRDFLHGGALRREGVEHARTPPGERVHIYKTAVVLFCFLFPPLFSLNLKNEKNPRRTTRSVFTFPAS